MYGKGITSDSQFIIRALCSIRELMEDDGLAIVYHRNIVPATGAVKFAKPLNRSVIGSMNDLVLQASDWLIEGDHSPHDVGFKLNEIPFSPLKYANPREAFKKLV